MYNKLLDFIPGTGDKAGNWYFENFGEACIYALIGFLIVFVGIVLIICIIWFIGFILRKTDNLAFIHKIKNPFKKKKNEAEKVIASGVQAEEEISDEVKAAIVAAIMAFYAEDSPKCEFVVKRIKRI